MFLKKTVAFNVQINDQFSKILLRKKKKDDQSIK
jgi:hypothetical protein